jgi:D-xylose transport system ATP-binding protein
VLDLCDRITVLKNGRLVGSRRATETDSEEILRMIVSGEATPSRPRPPEPDVVYAAGGR